MPAPLIPIILGAGMAAGGAGIMGKASQIKNTKPNQTLVGGSVEGAQGIQDRNATGIAAGAEQQGTGRANLLGGAHNAQVAADRFGADAQAVTRAQAAQYGQDRQSLMAFMGNRSRASDIGQQAGQNQMDAGNRAAMALAASSRGGNQAAAMRNAFSAQSASNAQAAQAAQMAASQQKFAEDGQQLQAQDQLSQLAMQQAGMNLGVAGQSAGLDAAAAAAQQQAGGQLLGAGLSREGNFLAAQTGNEGLQANLDQQTELARAEANRKWRAQMFATGGQLLTAGGTTMAGAGGGGGK